MKAFRITGLAIALVLVAWACGTAAAQQMVIDPIGNVTVGENITISGTTNLAPGDQLLVTVSPVAFGPTNKTERVGVTGVSGTVTVQKGEPANTWSFEVDTSQLEPGEYTVTVDWIEGEATATSTLNVVAGTPEVPATPTTIVTTPATTTAATPTPSPTPTPAASILPVIAMLAACVLAAYLGRR
jgi:hypothetical protein